MSRTNRFGFTLIEALLVIVITVILAIVTPNLISLQDRDREQKIKLNAHACQLYVEKARMNGSYPGWVANALNDTIYETIYRNPFGGLAFADGSPGREAGVCYYDVANDRKSYTITANGGNGRPILTLGELAH